MRVLPVLSGLESLENTQLTRIYIYISILVEASRRTPVLIDRSRACKDSFNGHAKLVFRPLIVVGQVAPQAYVVGDRSFTTRTHTSPHPENNHRGHLPTWLGFGFSCMVGLVFGGLGLWAVHTYAARCCAALVRTQKAFYQQSASQRT